MQGLNKIRSLESIAENEYNDASGAQRSTDGDILAISEIVPDSTVATPIGDLATLRVCNTSNSVAFLWAGKEDSIPSAVDITTGIALPPNFSKMIFVEASDDSMKSMMVKASNAAVQIVVMKD